MIRFRSRYLHLAGPFQIPVSEMMPVITGQRLGLMDDTGNSVLHHLHFSIHDRTLPHPDVSYGRSVRPSPLSGVTLGNGASGRCVRSTNLERVPGLNFKPRVISFGAVAVGDIRTRILTIENTAGAPVTASFPASGGSRGPRSIRQSLTGRAVRSSSSSPRSPTVWSKPQYKSAATPPETRTP
jgi:hypothetical protein